MYKSHRLDLPVLTPFPGLGISLLLPSPLREKVLRKGSICLTVTRGRILANAVWSAPG